MKRALWLVVALSACAGTAQPGPGGVDVAKVDADPQVTTAPAPRPRPSPSAEPDERPPAISVEPREPTMNVQVRLVALSEGRVAVDLTSEGWPGRAMGPELVSGDLRVDTAEHLHPTALRFTVDRAELPLGAEASVFYGDDEVARFVLPAQVTP